MMRASSVAEAHGARRRRGGRAAAARAADQAAGRRRGGRLGRGRDAAAPARRALAGRVQARDRRRAQGRGRPDLRVRPARPDPGGGGRVSVLPRAARPFVTLPGAAARERLCGRAGADHRVPRSRSACSARKSIADIRRAAHATLAPPPERRAAFDALFGAHFLGEMEEGEALGEPDDETVRVQEERAGGAEPLRLRRGQRGRAGRDRRRGAVGAPLRRRERLSRCCAASRVRRPRICRAVPATGACARAAASTSTRAAPCAKRCATTAT